MGNRTNTHIHIHTCVYICIYYTIYNLYIHKGLPCNDGYVYLNDRNDSPIVLREGWRRGLLLQVFYENILCSFQKLRYLVKYRCNQK